jgi:lysozyme
VRTLTPRIVLELLAHEGLVREAYRDSQGVWTWSVGITDASGHRVGRYRDNPQPLERCLAIYLWLLETRYLPPVLAAFGDHDPSEHELGGALSFHYNTGGIARAEWLRRFLAGEPEAARRAFLAWSRPRAIIPRRRRERDLFFDGAWSGDGACLAYEVAKPAYQPVRGRRIEIAATLARLMGEATPTPAEQPKPCAAPTPAVARATDETPAASSANWFERLFD